MRIACCSSEAESGCSRSSLLKAHAHLLFAVSVWLGEDVSVWLGEERLKCGREKERDGDVENLKEIEMRDVYFDCFREMEKRDWERGERDIRVHERD